MMANQRPRSVDWSLSIPSIPFAKVRAIRMSGS